MTTPHERAARRRWKDAAAAVPGPFFELVDPLPEHRWGGGFGWNDEGPINIDVLHQVDGVEISVGTNFHREPDTQFLKGQAFEIVWQEFMDDTEPITG